MKSIIKEVTARCTASVAHIIMAKTSNAIAAWPGLLKPFIGISSTTIKAIIAKGIPKTFKLMFVFKPPEFYS
ncbi:hypothetical protein GCM10025860_10910 [Methanobacterium ferruginis]|nr:hypothetical protein GCM10025860_10910 [Methanobacterium ferruginis]